MRTLFFLVISIAATACTTSQGTCGGQLTTCVGLTNCPTDFCGTTPGACATGTNCASLDASGEGLECTDAGCNQHCIGASCDCQGDDCTSFTTAFDCSIREYCTYTGDVCVDPTGATDEDFVEACAMRDDEVACTALPGCIWTP